MPGFAIPNTGSLPHISIAGTSSTGTHGSGNTLGNLSTIVRPRAGHADGELVTAGRASDPDRFDGMVLASGTLGIVTALTRDIVPTFNIRQDVYDSLPHEVYVAHFEEIMAQGQKRQRLQHLAVSS